LTVILVFALMSLADCPSVSAIILFDSNGLFLMAYTNLGVG